MGGRRTLCYGESVNRTLFCPHHHA